MAESGAENGLAAAMSEYEAICCFFFSQFATACVSLFATLHVSSYRCSEAAMSAAQKLLVTTRAPIAKQLIDAKRYVAKSAERCTEKLHGLVQRIDAHAKKLAELEKNTAERKRKASVALTRKGGDTKFEKRPPSPCAGLTRLSRIIDLAFRERLPLLCQVCACPPCQLNSVRPGGGCIPLFFFSLFC